MSEQRTLLTAFCVNQRGAGQVLYERTTDIAHSILYESMGSRSVYVLEEYQGDGLGKWLMECIHSHPVFEKLRRNLLFTTTAPWLYEKFGYEPVNMKNYAWAITRPDIYQ